jgi:DNA-binding IclR family transcriptional regulator
MDARPSIEDCAVADAAGMPVAGAARHPDPAFATTLQHGLQLLECFSVSEAALSNKELAQRTGLAKSTITRLTSTLASSGLIAFDTHLRRYRLGSSALTIGYPLMASLRIRQVARARMKQLSDDVGGSVSLGMRDRTRMIYVETSRGHDLSAWRPDIGAAIPMLPTAMGRAWLASAATQLRDAVLAQICHAEPNAQATFATDLAQAKRDLARRGFCISRGTWRSDVHAVAVPVRQPQDGEILVFNCGVVTARLAARQLEQQIGPRLIKLVREIEAELCVSA